MASEGKIWFITGCSSGLGLCITEHALQKGDKVVATLRKPEVLSELAVAYPERLLVLKLDVTKPEEVTAAFAASRERFGRIDVVVNNAGFVIIAEAEGTTDIHARNLFEVNFWGASHVSKEAIRFFREVNEPMGGRLLQISSVCGINATAGIAYYCASKFALEALSESLAKELDPDWNIKVTIIQPGPFRTKCLAVDGVFEPVHPAYGNPSLSSIQSRKLLADGGDAFLDGDPVKFAEAMRRLAYLEDPPLRLPIHTKALNFMRKKGKHLLETADKWESWSEDVLLED